MLGATHIVHSSTRHVHNLMKSQLYTYLREKDGWYCFYRLQGKTAIDFR